MQPMNRYLLTISFVVLFAGSILAQTTGSPGFRIEGRIRGLRDTTIRLAHYFGYNQYIPKDTARVDSSGRFVFTGKNTLPGGLYIVIPPIKSQLPIELVLGTPNFSFETDTTNFTASMRITGSPDNEAFYAYQKTMLILGNEARSIDLQTQFRTGKETQVVLRRQAADLRNRVIQLQKQYVSGSDSLFASKILRAALDPIIPAAPRLPNGKVDSTFQYRYVKDHFWDTFDFSDERLVRTPVFQRKIDRYLGDLTVPKVDSLIKSADLIVSKARGNREMLAYAIWYITSQYERPPVMGTDGLFVHMAETYYLSGVMPSADPVTIANIRKRVETVKPLLVGKPFPAIALSDTLRQPVDLKAVQADYTVLFFYDPTCAHCRESMPKLREFATDSVKSRGVRFYAISIDNSPYAWQQFIREYGIQNWVNGYDYTFRNDYRKTYDVLTTPTVYVLDKDKTIVARALPVEQLANFIDYQRRLTSTTAVSR